MRPSRNGEPVSKRIIASYVAALVALGCALLLVPPTASAAGWPLVGVLSASAMVFGVRRNRPARTAPWWLLAGAVVSGSAGDAFFALDGGDAGPFALLSDACYLAMFPLIGAGMVGLTRASVVLRDRSRLLGVLMLTCAVALVAWVLWDGRRVRARLAALEAQGIRRRSDASHEGGSA